MRTRRIHAHAGRGPHHTHSCDPSPEVDLSHFSEHAYTLKQPRQPGPDIRPQLSPGGAKPSEERGSAQQSRELTRRLHLRNRRVPKSNVHIRRIEHQDRLQRYMRNQHHVFAGQLRWQDICQARFGLPGVRSLPPYHESPQLGSTENITCVCSR